ncbi:MAG: Eco57I restriction-modification methylase domain-containing protein, partial [Prevotellaceae bacterium]|nr:Eco57I restriction-modification methylase domain-containing protein [Prevotellaceae bacterium]
MQTTQTPKQALNPAFLKQKPERKEIELFKKEFIALLDRINEKETEEHHKNLMIDFLNSVYYKDNHYINTKGRADLVICNGKTPDSPVGVLIEVKSPVNKTEMVSRQNLNVKSFQELVLYYLRERKNEKNFELRYLIITNIYEWFVFDAQDFEKLFYQNKKLIAQFEQFNAKKLSGTNTDFFYTEIAAPTIADIQSEIPYTHFDIRDYDKILRNTDQEDDRKLIALYKFLSPTHLLKLPFADDNNQLNREFYAELLHILGLEEMKQGTQKFIVRPKEENRDSGSIIENAIEKIDEQDKLSHLNAEQYGQTKEEQLFNSALDLSITWINRVLFLKLLEAQIIKYNSFSTDAGLKRADFAFLSVDKLSNYDDLNSLFFQILARKENERKGDLKTKFLHVPYLNSSLFEKTEIEDKTIYISGLKDDISIKLYSKSVLHGGRDGARPVSTMRPLEYLLKCLDAYDFSSESSEDIQEENKQLISASVLGLIFEKINGYKDGSFFTPSFITMYMCRETIRKTVLQKFNDYFAANAVETGRAPFLQTTIDLYNKLDRIDIQTANRIFNSIRICDPAVGSGHFLVSALNEMIALKSELGILADKTGKRLKDYHIIIENDELIITDSEGDYFQYNPKNAESQRVQETLFHEKQTIIENCLFGVDINPNSVKICQLRLWIELLKNAYYLRNTDNADNADLHELDNKNLRKSVSSALSAFPTLQTLPNIDINIKCGNSLISRFDLRDKYSENATMQQRVKVATEKYKAQVFLYKDCNDKETKRQITKNIETEKQFFYQLNNARDTDYQAWNKAHAELTQHTQGTFFDFQDEAWQQKTTELTQKTANLEKIYKDKIRSCFEWRFEFPEVLDDDGNFVGFDAVIGNPPYIQLQSMGSITDDYKKMNYQVFERTGDIYCLFYELGYKLLKNKSYLSFITSNKWMRAGYGEKTRKFFVEQTNPVLLIDFAGVKVFDEATVDVNILSFQKSENQHNTKTCQIKHFNYETMKLSDYCRHNEIFTGFNEASISSFVILSD